MWWYCFSHALSFSAEPLKLQYRACQVHVTLYGSLRGIITSRASGDSHATSQLCLIGLFGTGSSCAGVVLSQRQGNLEKLHPSAFFSRQPWTARHQSSIRGVATLVRGLPASLYCAHRPPQPRVYPAGQASKFQASPLGLFTRFNFSIFFRPGSKNGKADVLSHQFTIPEPEEDPGYILAASLVAASIEWDLDEVIAQETRSYRGAGLPPRMGLMAFECVCVLPEFWSRSLLSFVSVFLSAFTVWMSVNCLHLSHLFSNAFIKPV